jgi:integrase
MPSWKTKWGWRYRFQLSGEFYGKSGFKTKKESEAAEAAHRKKLKPAKNSAPEPQKSGFASLTVEYLEWGKRRFADKTWKYKRFVFQTFLDRMGDMPLSDLSLPALEKFLLTRHSNSNYNRFRKELCCLLAWARKRRYVDTDPCFDLEKLKEDHARKIIPTQDDMRRLLLAAGEDRPLILVLYHTLARIDEALRLRWQDVNFQEQAVTLWTRKRQGGEWASDTMHMNQVLYDTLWTLWKARKQEEWVFLNPRSGTRYIYRPKLMRSICKRAGVRHFGFHAIRHYVASFLHDAKKISVSQVSKLLRHQNKATTERYLQVVDPGSRAAMKALEGDFLMPLNDQSQNSPDSCN